MLLVGGRTTEERAFRRRFDKDLWIPGSDGIAGTTLLKNATQPIRLKPTTAAFKQFCMDALSSKTTYAFETSAIFEATFTTVFFKAVTDDGFVTYAMSIPSRISAGVSDLIFPISSGSSAIIIEPALRGVMYFMTKAEIVSRLEAIFDCSITLVQEAHASSIFFARLPGLAPYKFELRYTI